MIIPDSCWNSLQCLQDWKRYLGYVAAGLAGFAAIAVILAEVVVESRINTLGLPRKIDDSQRRTLIKRLSVDPGTHVQVHAYVTSDESQRYAAALVSVLKEAGWSADGPVLYTRDQPFEGLRVIIDSWNNVPPLSRLLLDSLREVGIRDVAFEVEPSPVMPSSWILIRVGLKPGTVANQD